MVVTGILLIVLGVLLGLVFPVMFVAAAAGAVILVVALVGGARRAQTGAVGSEHTPE